ncbi:MAG: N-acetyltransferase [Candidatus Latescibacterota bacterium]
MITYRRANEKDFLQIAVLDGIAWLDNRNAACIPDGEHVWRIWTEHALVYCGETAGKIMGAICAFPCVSGDCCLHKVFVAKAYRHMGVGSQLSKMLLMELDRQQLVCFLTVDPANEHAIRLYEKWGFADKEFVKGYYRSNEDRYVLTRKHRGTWQSASPETVQ